MTRSLEPSSLCSTGCTGQTKACCGLARFRDDAIRPRPRDRRDHPMRRASELIICFNIRSAGCDLVGRHEAKRGRVAGINKSVRRLKPASKVHADRLLHRDESTGPCDDRKVIKLETKRGINFEFSRKLWNQFCPSNERERSFKLSIILLSV